jgi:hypothetical protein
MWKWIVCSAVALGVLVLAPPIQATPLPPGSSGVLVSPGVETGTLIATASGSYAGLIPSMFAGTFLEKVYKESGGTLNFDFQFKATAGDVTRMTIADYSTPIIVGDVSQTAIQLGFATGTQAVSTADRTANGMTIGFNFDTLGNVVAGSLHDTTFVLIVSTSATTTDTGTIAFQDGGSATRSDIGPVIVPRTPGTPEPTSLILLGGLSLGIGGVGLRRWRTARSKLS